MRSIADELRAPAAGRRIVVLARRTTTRSATAPSATALPPAKLEPRRSRSSCSRAVHAAPLPGRGGRRAGAVPVLQRPCRPGDRGRDARGATARVPPFAGFRRRGSGPAGSGDVRALALTRAGDEAHRDEIARLLPAAPRAARRARRRPRRRGRPRAGAAPRRRATLVADFARETVELRSDEARLARRGRSRSAPTLGRRGDELLALLRARRAGRALPLRRGGRRDAATS